MLRAVDSRFGSAICGSGRVVFGLILIDLDLSSELGR